MGLFLNKKDNPNTKSSLRTVFNILQLLILGVFLFWFFAVMVIPGCEMYNRGDFKGMQSKQNNSIPLNDNDVNQQSPEK
jgi:hypothetical protein